MAQSKPVGQAEDFPGELASMGIRSFDAQLVECKICLKRLHGQYRSVSEQSVREQAATPLNSACQLAVGCRPLPCFLRTDSFGSSCALPSSPTGSFLFLHLLEMVALSSFRAAPMLY